MKRGILFLPVVLVLLSCAAHTYETPHEQTYHKYAPALTVASDQIKNASSALGDLVREGMITRSEAEPFLDVLELAEAARRTAEEAVAAQIRTNQKEAAVTAALAEMNKHLSDVFLFLAKYLDKDRAGEVTL